MALIKCPECGKEISDQAKACIYCGYPISKMKPIVKNNDVEHATVTSEIKEQTSTVKNSPDKPSVYSQMNEKQKKKITVIAVVVVLTILAIWGIATAIDKKAAKSRDLSNVFDFSFDMTMDDVIAYEAEKYGNTEYEREKLANGSYRLDFDKYITYSYVSYNYDDHWKHMYFFEKETGLLESIHYMTFDDKDGAECEHVRQLKRKLLKEIGEWDEKPIDSSIRVAYGQIDGVPCKIKYYDDGIIISITK